MASVYGRVGTLTLFPHLAKAGELDRLADAILQGQATPRRGRRPDSVNYLTTPQLRQVEAREVPASAFDSDPLDGRMTDVERNHSQQVVDAYVLPDFEA